MNRKIDIRIITPDMHPVRRPVLLVHLREGDRDHAYQLNLRGTAPQEVAKDIQYAVQKLLDGHEMPQKPAIGHWKERVIWVCNSDGEPVAPLGLEYECDQCGKVVYLEEPHCPECGAIMREPREEDM